MAHRTGTEAEARRLANLRPPFPPGVSGNPTGDSKITFARKLFSQALESKNAHDLKAIYSRMKNAAIKGNVRAAQFVVETAYGKPAQAITNGDDGEFIFKVIRETVETK